MSGELLNAAPGASQPLPGGVYKVAREYLARVTVATTRDIFEVLAGAGLIPVQVIPGNKAADAWGLGFTREILYTLKRLGLVRVMAKTRQGLIWHTRNDAASRLPARRSEGE